MLPGFGDGLEPERLDGRVAFRAMTVDGLPALGHLPAEPGLFACLALGSRGMTWAALAAEIVASRIDGDPMPVERDLLAALDVGRFINSQSRNQESTPNAKTQRTQRTQRESKKEFE
jgi:tRNA 5-methylaminomethyl-2-thiouridine biosynthesis bifunctional protein